RGASDELTARWLARIAQRVAIDENRVFPTEELLDHVPVLIAGIADFVEDPSNAVVADSTVVAKAMELGALRHAQGFDEYELLKEYEIFGGILYSFLASAVDDIDMPCSRSELILCAHRLYQAISLIQQATTIQFLALMKDRIREREERLRAFNRTLTHELRNRIGATMGAGQLLQMPEIPDTERERLVGIVVRNMESMRVALDNLLELTHLSADARQQRHIVLPAAAAEVIRQLRELARSRRVRVRLHESLPTVEVNAAAVELCLMNFVSNAIKYADESKDDRWVEIMGRTVPATEGAPAFVVVEVRDNGLGVADSYRESLFQRFFRAGVESVSGVEGTGLGLSIVRETVESLGGRAWAEFQDGVSVFSFSLPVRRAGDLTPTDAVASVPERKPA
ncbi:MAG TPA: HAMP domain-containing sensor histidine kinase, partial [Gemmatimonadaceae bacterium]|nr:HAMP domain-containing sensor histidine kinase [Gemmatimonadaceae bacterium]